eukprot:SAG31_NODE_404_length_16109_cov_10.686696_8_plen_301_part_00
MIFYFSKLNLAHMYRYVRAYVPSPPEGGGRVHRDGGGPTPSRGSGCVERGRRLALSRIAPRHKNRLSLTRIMAWRPLSLLVLWVLLVPDGLCFEIDMEILGALDKVLDKIEDNGSPQPPIDPVDDASSERKATRFRVDESGTPMAVDSEQQQQQQQQRRSAAQECEEFEPEDLVLPDEEEEGNDFADNDSEDLLDQGSAQQRLPAASISETSKDSSLDAAFAELDTEFDSAASPRQTKAGRKKSRRERALDGARKRRSKDMSKTAYVAANVDAFAGANRKLNLHRHRSCPLTRLLGTVCP